MDSEIFGKEVGKECEFQGEGMKSDCARKNKKNNNFVRKQKRKKVASGKTVVAEESNLHGYKQRVRRDMGMRVSGKELEKTGDFDGRVKKERKRGGRGEERIRE